MGFKFEERLAHIEFDDTTPYPGAVVDMSLEAPMEMLFRFMEFAERDDVKAAERRSTFKEFGDLVLKSWNLEKPDGTPYPANGEGLLAQTGGFRFAGELLQQWIRAANADDAPLDEQSTDGGGSVVPLAQTGSE